MTNNIGQPSATTALIAIIGLVMTSAGGCGTSTPPSKSGRTETAKNDWLPVDEELQKRIESILQRGDLDGPTKQDRIVELMRVVYPEVFHLVDEAGSQAGLKGAARVMVEAASPDVAKQIRELRALENRRAAYQDNREKNLTNNPEWQKLAAESVDQHMEIYKTIAKPLLVDASLSPDDRRRKLDLHFRTIFAGTYSTRVHGPVVEAMLTLDGDELKQRLTELANKIDPTPTRRKSN